MFKDMELSKDIMIAFDQVDNLVTDQIPNTLLSL